MKEEADRLRQKARTAEGRMAFLKHHYLEIMRFHGLKKVQGDAYTLSVRASEAVTVTENPGELAALAENEPLFFQKIETIKPDKRALREALKGGQKIPGCELQTSYSLQIR